MPLALSPMAGLTLAVPRDYAGVLSRQSLRDASRRSLLSKPIGLNTGCNLPSCLGLNAAITMSFVLGWEVWT
jgi:hypothetical protein